MNANSSRSRQNRARSRQGASADGAIARTSLATAGRLIAVGDARVFRPENRDFCERLIQVALRQPEIASVFVSLEDQMCRMTFSGGPMGQAEMAARFVQVVAESLAPEPAPPAPLLGPGARGWDVLSGYKRDSTASVWVGIGRDRGRLRLKNPSITWYWGLAQQIVRGLRAMPGIDSARAAQWSTALDVQFDPEHLAVADLLDDAESLRLQAFHAELKRDLGAGHAPPEIAHGPRRLEYLALAAGSFGLTIAGAFLPVLPTIPFLLLTSYFLARSSRPLSRMLDESRFFGPVIRDWQEHGALGRQSKTNLIELSLFLSCVSVLLTPTLLNLVMVIVFAWMSIYVILRIRGIAPDEEFAGALPPPLVTAS